MNLRRQLAIIKAWLPLLVACAVLAGTAALVVSNLQQKVYEARATLIVGQSLSAANPDYSQLLVSQRLSTTYAAVATKRPMLEAVVTQLGLDVSSDELAQKVRADAPLDSTLLTITAQDTEPTRAAAIANALAEQLIAASPTIQGRQAEFQRSIEADLAATQDLIVATQARLEALSGLTDRTPEQDMEMQTLEGRLVSLRSTYATLLPFSSGSAANLLSVIEPAVSPTAPVSPKPLLNMLVAALIGLLVAAGIAFGVDHLDDAIKDSDAVEEVTGLSMLGAIAVMKGDRERGEIYRLATLLHPRSGVAEAYRALRTNVEFASVDASIRTLLVTSAIPGEGKTVTAANLAVAFAQAGRHVLLVDADLRKPGVDVIFDLPNAHGLTTLLRGDDVSLDALAHVAEQANLRVLTTGPLPPNPAELLGSQRMRTVLEHLAGSADLLIFDSPPLNAVTDSAILSSLMDGTLLVVDSGRSRRRAVRLAGEVLARAGANVLGVVLNRVPAPSRSDYARYYSGAYGSSHLDERAAQGTEGSPVGPSPVATQATGGGTAGTSVLQ